MIELLPATSQAAIAAAVAVLMLIAGTGKNRLEWRPRKPTRKHRRSRPR